MPIPTALTIAGSDPSGGAGLQADLKTFHQHGVYGMSVVTLLTVQNTRRVSAVEPLSAELVEAQLEACLEDIPPAAVKTGALGRRELIEVVARWAPRLDGPLVVDPVMISKHGRRLLDPDAVRTLVERLLPAALLVTPNVPEAELLAQRPITDLAGMEVAARYIAELGPRSVLVKGGHLDGPPVDVLLVDERLERLPAERLATRHTHGTGCVYSAAITARLAQGCPLVEAVRAAKRFISRAIRTAPGLGHGFGPVNMHAPLEEIAMDIAGPRPEDEAAPRPRRVVESHLDPVALVRRAIEANPEMTADELVELLAEQNVEVSGVLVAAELSRWRARPS